MKSIQKRLYTVLPRHTPPRPRSNSASSGRTLYTSSNVPLSFFDSPPPPPSSSRSGLTSPNRLPAEPKPTELEGPPNSQHHGHSGQSTTHTGGPFSQLALTSPPSNSNHTLSPYSPAHAALFPYSSQNILQAPSAGASADEHTPRAVKRPQLKYQLDVGAYGIPKRCRPPSAPVSIPQDDLSLAVQVGEDAYFVRSNAMGVADGVGGWARSKPECPTISPSPSALFARRLMHFCSAELDSLPIRHPIPAPPQTTSTTTPPPLSPSFPLIHPRPLLSSLSTPWYWSDPAPPFEYDEYEHDADEALQDSLDELSEGIDVLHILERAYDRTIKAHVVPPPPVPSPSPSKPPPAEPTPLLTGSSTALLAILDHAPPSILASSAFSTSPSPKTQTQTQHTSPSPAPFNYAAGSLNCTLQPLPTSSTPAVDPKEPYDAVIKIAHIGDCMGMLVRGEDIAWRSEEMWWDFNTPVQLGPSTPTTPLTSAHSFTLPVRADDILILASDGLSDNLWDEDVLDEVVRFKRSFWGDASASSSSNSSSGVGSPSPDIRCASPADRLLRRRTLAGMLSEALCSRARRVSERRAVSSSSPSPQPSSSRTCHPTPTRPPPIPEEPSSLTPSPTHTPTPPRTPTPDPYASEVPFARRAREVGKVFRGGKNDDISVIVAVISPLSDLPPSPPPAPAQKLPSSQS